MNYQHELQHGLALIENQEFDTALQIAKRLQQMQPDSADGFHLAAIACQYRLRWEESIAYIDQAVALAKEHSQLFNLRAFALMSLNRYEEAEKDLIISIRFDDNPAAHRNFGMLKILQGNIAEGLNYLMDRIQTQPNDPYNWVVVGDLIMGEGLEKKALSYYQKALSLMPNDPYLQQLVNQYRSVEHLKEAQ